MQDKQNEQSVEGGKRELAPSAQWVRMATPDPKTWVFDVPKEHPSGRKAAFDGRGDVDGPDAANDFFAPKGWRFLAVHDDDFSTATGFSRVKKGSAVISREEQVDAILDFGRDYALWCQRQMDDSGSETDRLMRGEEEHGRKLTVSKGYYPGYDTPPASPARLELPSWYHEQMRAVLGLYLYHDDPRVANAPLQPIVIETSAGWPIFNTGIGAKVLSSSFYIHGKSFEEMRVRAAEWAAGRGLDPISAFGNGYGTRTGTNIKPSKVYRYDGVGWSAFGEMESRFCRRRQIYMATIVTALCLRNFTRLAKMTRKYVIPGAWHTGEDDTLLMSATEDTPGEWVEADISGYDTNLTRDHAHAFLQAARTVRPDLIADATDYFEIDDIGTIFPHPDGTGSENRHARYVTRQGLLSSGILPTAEMGNIYHLPIIGELARRCGIKDPWPALLRKEWVILIQGDDLLIKLKGLTPELMLETYAEAGLTVKTVKANRFLMRHRFKDVWYPVAARVFQGTAFGEHEPLGPHSLPLAVIGYVARQAHGVHPLLEHKVREFTSLTDLPRHGIIDRKSGLAWLRSDVGSRLVEQALSSLSSDSWLMRIKRDAEWSTSSAAILQYARNFGFTDDRDIALTKLGNRAIDTLLSLPRNRVDDVRNNLWKAWMDGVAGVNLDALALKLLRIEE